jgi:hypothetical protein
VRRIPGIDIERDILATELMDARIFGQLADPLPALFAELAMESSVSVVSPLRPSQVPHKRDRQDRATWIRRERLGR